MQSNCESFDFEKKIQGICFDQVFSKACQYGKMDEKVCWNLKYDSIKYA